MSRKELCLPCMILIKAGHYCNIASIILLAMSMLTYYLCNLTDKLELIVTTSIYREWIHSVLKSKCIELTWRLILGGKTYRWYECTCVNIIYLYNAMNMPQMVEHFCKSKISVFMACTFNVFNYINMEW